MDRKLVASGAVVLREKSYHYEFWSNNVDITVKMFHRGKTGDSTEFTRSSNAPLKKEMEDALVNAQFFK